MLPILALISASYWKVVGGLLQMVLSFPTGGIWAEGQFTLSSDVHKVVNWAFEVVKETLFAYEIK